MQISAFERHAGEVEVAVEPGAEKGGHRGGSGEAERDWGGEDVATNC